MKSKQASPIWPYLGILACLFVLSVTAPRAWDRMARQETLSHALLAKKTRVAPVQAAPAPERYEKVDDAELTGREAIGAEPARSGEATPVAEPNTEPATAHPPAAESPPAEQAVPPAPQVVNEPGPFIEVNNRTDTPADEPEPEITSVDEPAPEPAPAGNAWPLPRVLMGQLARLAQQDSRGQWAERAGNLIRDLCRPAEHNGGSAEGILKQLRELAQPDGTVAEVDSPQESQTVRARYALARWLDIWEGAVDLEKLSIADVRPRYTPEVVRARLADVESLLRKGPGGAGWRDYLQLESLRDLANRPQLDDEHRVAARKVLDRLSYSRLTRSQWRFVNQEPLIALQTELRSWAAQHVTAAQLLTHLEQYEYTLSASDARLVADDFRGLGWSAPQAAENVSERLDTHYRNANVRVACAGALANRLVPQPGKVDARVQDVVVNVPVSGRSTTSTQLFVRLVPDARRIRLGLEARGLVDSNTTSSSGPATFYNQGQSTFLARKLMVLGPQGLSVWPAVAEAENNYSYLVSLETDFDGVPLMGALVRNIARSQHDESLDEARLEVEYKVATRARDQLDAEVRPQLIKAAQRIEKEQLATLKRLGLDLVPLGLSTTEERVVARVRLGGPEQLGAHTPRLRAPADSWFSMQLHQSALNNALERLDLDGRSFALPELFAWTAEKLNRPQLAKLDDLPDNVHLTFAKQDAVRLRCEDGRVEVRFAFAELKQGRNRWRNFTVRTLYWPEADNLDPRFVRDPTISFDGKSLKGKPEFVLRAIFSKVLSRNRDLRLLGEAITSDPRLKDLQVTQFAVEDGWIGLAYSPQRANANVARRPRLQPQPQSP